MHRSLTRMLAAEFGLFACLIGCAMYATTGWVGGDFATYYVAAHTLRLNPGANVYQWAVMQREMVLPGVCHPMAIAPFVYPQAFAFLLEPFTLLPCGAAFIAWNVLDGVWFAGSLLLVNALWPMRPRQFMLLGSMMLVSLPVLINIWLGQIGLLILFGLLLVLWRYQRGDAIGAGITLALITYFQLIPALLLVYFLAQRAWRVLAVTAVMSLLLLLWTLSVVGLMGVQSFVQTVLTGHVSAQETRSASLAYHIGPWYIALVALIYLVVLWHSTTDPIRAYLWTITSMLMLSPLLWLHLLIWLVPILAYWWIGRRQWIVPLVFAFTLYAANQFIILQVVILAATWLLLAWDQIAISFPKLALALRYR